MHVRADHLRTDNDRCLYNIVLSGHELQETLVPAVLTTLKPEAGAWSYTDYIERVVETLD